MPSSDIIDNVTLPEIASPITPEPSRGRIAFRNHIKLLAFLVAVYALIFNRAMYINKPLRQQSTVQTPAPVESNPMTVSYIR